MESLFRKRNILAILIVLTVFIIAASLFLLPTAKVARADGSAVADELYFGRGKLAGNTAELGAYDALVEGVSDKRKRIELGEYNLTAAQVARVYEMYSSDHVEHYWLPNNRSVYSSGEKITAFEFTYLSGFNDAVFETEAAKYLKLVEGVHSEYEKALIIHDAIVSTVVYDGSAPNAHNAYGAIVGKRAVCEGYAEAYQYLLQRCGIMSYIVTGESHGEGHEWNLVRIDGRFYYTDVTWDDPVSSDDANKPIFHAYFNITTERLAEDHDTEDNYSVLPVCNSETALYSGMDRISSYSASGVASVIELKGNIGKADLYFEGATDNFSSWFTNETLSEIISKTPFAGKGAVSFSASSCGREHILTFVGPVVHAASVSLDVPSLSIKAGETASLTATLTPADYCSDIVEWTSSDDAVATVDPSGKITAVKQGSVTITATAGSKHAICTVTVEPLCYHADKTLVEASPSTCVKRGNEAYYICNECDKLFDSALNEIDGIKYLPLTDHNLGELHPAHAATCSSSGNVEYATCAACGNNFDKNGEILSSVIIPPTHKYGQPVWSWEGYTKASATLTCAECGNVRTFNAVVTDLVTALPSENECGECVYTATVSVDGNKYTDTKTEILDPRPIYSEPEAPESVQDSSDESFFASFINIFTFGGAMNGYVGLAIVIGGLLLFILLCVIIGKALSRNR